MISKGYRYVIILGIVSNFYISVDPVYPVSSVRESTVADELRGIWILSSL